MLSRRQCLRMSTVAALARSASAEETPTKATQAAARYQDHPNNMQMCGMCKVYIPPGGQAGSGMMGGRMGPGMMGRQKGSDMMSSGTCEVVEGSVSPMGWCVLYRPISS
jgi:hypothetical protein